MRNDYSNYRENYSDAALWSKVSKCATKMGSMLVYNVLVLYYTLMSPGMPLDVKLKIVGALGYVIFPADAIPDVIPVVGFTDDLAAVAYVITSIMTHITPQIRERAAAKVRDIFGSDNGCVLAA